MFVDVLRCVEGAANLSEFWKWHRLNLTEIRKIRFYTLTGSRKLCVIYQNISEHLRKCFVCNRTPFSYMVCADAKSLVHLHEKMMNRLVTKWANLEIENAKESTGKIQNLKLELK